MSDDDDQERFEGVNFTDLNPVLEDLSYPITAEEFVEEYGDRELSRTNADPIEVGTVLEYMGDTTFESEEELRQQIVGQMPSDTEGRTNYSDRGGSNPTTTEAAEEAEDQTAADVEEGEATDPDTTQQ
jgi:hypothetical protein